MNPAASDPSPRVRIGVSACLLGDAVRYDGGHKRQPLMISFFETRAEWVSVCPEVELGLGVPREPIHLVDSPGAPRLVTVTTGRDITAPMVALAREQVGRLASLRICGYVLKSDSPSCGLRVPVHGSADARDAGVFARVMVEELPRLPVVEESGLATEAECRRFLERVLAYQLDSR